MDEEKRGMEHIIGSAVMDNHFNFTIADEDIYSFFGERVIPLFTAYIHPDDRENFIAAVEDCDRVSDRYVTLRLKNFTGQYCIAIVFIKPNHIDPEQFFDLEIYDIVYLVQEYNALSSAYQKVIHTMQLLNPSVTFDYNPKTGNIVLFTDRDDVSYNGDIDELYKMIVENDYIEKMHVSGLHKLIDGIKKCNAGAGAVLNMRFHKEEKIKPISIRTTVLYDKDSTTPSSVIGVANAEEVDTVNSTERIYNNRSNLDPLTGLYNKAAIKEMAIDALHEADEVITYVMIDLDHFKDVNDTYGHMFGDEVILNAARLIKNAVGKNGFVGRVGGDEFFIVLKGIGSELEELRPVLRTIRSQIEWAYKGKLGGIKLTTSIGCASYPKDAENYDDLFMLADRCLYFAKTKGRNRFIIYTKEIHGSLEEIKASDKTIKMDRTVNDSQRLEFVTDAVIRLSDWRSGAINSVMKDMLPYFNMSEVMVYDMSTGKAIYSTEPIDEDEKENICNYFGTFKAAFRESNVLSYGESTNLKMPYPDFYEYMVQKEYFSLFVYAIKDKGEITHLAAAYTKGKYMKWSEMAIDCLNILFKTIGDKILND